MGALRWAAPQPVAPWAGVRSAKGYGPACPQQRVPLPNLDVGETDEGRSLVLNVDTPRADGARRPVMVWIHGGAYLSGSGSVPLYDGARLAARRDVVVVTLHYRLGALGYLDLTSLGGAAERGAVPNRGQLDQIAALRWVGQNIERFGGDPQNVTLFGESAGAMAIATLLAMPEARGLFQKVILQSGAAHDVLSSESAAEVAQSLLEELALDSGSLERLWELPVETLIEAQGRVAQQPGPPWLRFAPVVDGASLPRAPLAAIAAGEARDIPVLIGTNLDETKFFSIGASRTADLEPERVVRRVRRLLPQPVGHAAAGLVEGYRKARAERGASLEGLEIFDAIETDLRFRVPAIRLAESQCGHQPHTYMYLWTWPSPALRGTLGACHAIELPFVFGRLDLPGMARFSGTGPEAEWLSAQLMDAWVAFARRGCPHNVGWSDWPAYEEKERQTFEIGPVPRLQSAPLDLERALWDGLL